MGTVTGTSGADTLGGTSAADTIAAAAGDDLIYGSAGGDQIDGGAGSDTLDFEIGGSQSPGLARTSGSRGITIGASAIGDSAGQIATGFTGIETIVLGSSRTSFQGFSSGTTTIDAAGFTGSGGLTVYNMLGLDALVLTGTAVADRIAVGQGSHRLDGGAGTDALSYGFYGSASIGESGGVRTFDAGSHHTTAANFESVSIGVIGGAGAIDAAALTRGVTFRASYDLTIVGGAGDDLFDNAFSGGSRSGASSFTGGGGSDTYRYTGFGANFAADHITDFSAADRIDLSPIAGVRFIGGAGFSGVVNQLRYAFVGGTTQIQADTNGDGTADDILTIDNGAVPLVETAPGSAILMIGSAITGTAGNDQLIGTAGNDVIDGVRGSDTIRLTTGHDMIVARSGFTARLIADMNDAAIFPQTAGAAAYTVTATRISNAGGTLDTGFAAGQVSAITITDRSAAAHSLDTSGYPGGILSVTAVFGAGDDVVFGGRGLDIVDVGLGNNIVDGGPANAIGTNNDSVKAAVDSSATRIATIAQTGGAYTLDYRTETASYRTSARNIGLLSVESGIAGQGLHVDATAVTSPSVQFYDSAADDVIVGGRGDDIIRSLPAGSSILPGEISGGSDRLTGNGGRDMFNYEEALPTANGDHILDLDADDHVSFSYYSYSDADGSYPVSGEPIFLGSGAFTGRANQIRTEIRDGRTYILTDLDGDRIADGTIEIRNGAFDLVEDRTQIYGGGYSNILKIATAQTIVDGSDAADTGSSTAGADVARGYGGDDVWQLSSGADFFDGGTGNDTLVGRIGDASLFPVQTGARSYRIEADRLYSVEAGQAPGYDRAAALATNFLGVERIRFDTSSSGDFADRIDASAFGGSVEIVTGNGNDVLVGTAGNDSLSGGGGADTAVYAGLYRGYTLAMHDGSGTVAGGIGGGIDSIASIETLAFRDGYWTSDADSAAAQVMRLYDTVLHRMPDAIGLDYWAGQMADGLGYASVASAFLGSAEFQAATGSLSDPAYVDFLYQSALGRGADPAGKAYWLDQLGHGATRADLLGGFSESAEHRGSTAPLLANGLFVTDADYKAVAALYDTLSDRQPDAAGLVYWADRIESGVQTLGQVADGFAASAEFTAALAGKSNAAIVAYMYQNTLDRPGETAGIAYWTDLLDHGLTRGQLLLGFSDSAEHYLLLTSHITGGIEVLGA